MAFLTRSAFFSICYCLIVELYLSNFDHHIEPNCSKCFLFAENSLSFIKQGSILATDEN